MSTQKRIGILVFVLILLLSLTMPLSAFADPVSATIMANAFAQAIASYGAANGVGMAFDVASTDGIGQTVHDLWTRFRNDQQTADDYATLAAAIFPDLYYKTAVAIGAASDAVAVGVHISDTYAETFDDFYNWLLSGPAQMVQVDNSYYEWASSQIGSSAVPIQVVSVTSGPFAGQPLVFNANASSMTIPQRYAAGTQIYYSNNSYTTAISTSSDVFCFYYTYGSYTTDLCFASKSSGAIVYVCPNSSVSNQKVLSSYDNVSGFYYANARLTGGIPFNASHFDNTTLGLAALNDYLDNPSNYSDTLGVQGYGDATAASFPDTGDPNYDALNRAKDIPLNIPWDDTLFGDGTDVLTDAQSQAIAGELTNALARDRMVELTRDTTAPITPDYSDVLLPLIPINVPSFNFSLSGIWHYVREWVTSLGAWLSYLFSIWAILPYAIVVPVYACLVIVIVLGVYKRFFM